MKLIFKKDKDSQINVFQKINDKEKEFSYVEMIKDLIETKTMEAPDVSDGFSDEEIKSIKSMAEFINKEVVVEEDASAEDVTWDE